MKPILMMAFRNLGRNFRRSLITLVSISLGVAVILWLQCILSGSNQNIIDSVTGTHGGHLQIYQKDYLPEYPLAKVFPEVPAVVKSLPERVAGYSPRVSLSALASTGEASSPLRLVGVDPVLEGRTFSPAKSKVAGEYLGVDDSPDCAGKQIYLGRTLANTLKTSVGGKVVILAQALDGTLGNELFRVKGIFDSGSPEFDKGVAFTTLNCARRVGAVEGFHEIAIQLARSSDISTVQAALRKDLDPQLSLTTWREAMPFVSGIVNFNNATLVLIGVMLSVLITLGAVDTLLVSVFERTREFGLMIALGTQPRQVILMVLFEAALLGLLSIALGSLLGSLAVLYHQQVGFDVRLLLGKELDVGSFRVVTLVRPSFNLILFFKMMGSMMGFMLLAALYPAFRAAGLNPTEAMRSH
ncbi:MAG: ABC transporter permease [Bacteriovoracia bacterium]